MRTPFPVADVKLHVDDGCEIVRVNSAGATFGALNVDPKHPIRRVTVDASALEEGLARFEAAIRAEYSGTFRETLATVESMVEQCEGNWIQPIELLNGLEEQYELCRLKYLQERAKCGLLMRGMLDMAWENYLYGGMIEWGTGEEYRFVHLQDDTGMRFDVDASRARRAVKTLMNYRGQVLSWDSWKSWAKSRKDVVKRRLRARLPASWYNVGH